VKYKITSIWDMKEYLFPFLDAYPLQAKKAKPYALFKEIVLMLCEKKHLSDAGFERIVELRDELRALGKKAKTYYGNVSEFDKESNKQPLKNARVRENRLPRVEENYNGNIIKHQIPPVNPRESEVPEISLYAGLRQIR
jgi:hypothetical protein